MKSEVVLKYLYYFRNRSDHIESGFTLIELLVVVIIIGVLAAVALPNLLGQVGKARETEAKNGVGSINRAQQAYHFEKGTFTGTLLGPSIGGGTLQANNALGVIIPASKYYNIDVNSGIPANAAFSSVEAQAVNTGGFIDAGAAQGTRNFVGQIQFTATNGAYDTIICQADVSGIPNSTVVTVAGSAVAGTCAVGDTKVQ